MLREVCFTVVGPQGQVIGELPLPQLPPHNQRPIEEARRDVVATERELAQWQMALVRSEFVLLDTERTKGKNSTEYQNAERLISRMRLRERALFERRRGMIRRLDLLRGP